MMLTVWNYLFYPIENKSMVETKDIYWLAGLLEGEGSFLLRSGHASKGALPVVQLGMTDRDVVEKARRVMGHRGKICVQGLGTSARRSKPLYNFVVASQWAIGWMMTLYQFMGERRQSDIRAIIAHWRESPAHGKWARRKGYRYGEPRSVEARE